MTDKMDIIHEMLMNACSVLEMGGMALKCDSEMNVISQPVVIDNLAISQLGCDGEKIVFYLGWRPIGVTKEFSSGAFNVENPEFLRVTGFSNEEGQILFNCENGEGEKFVLCITPLDEEYREEWEEWNRFKRKNRDYFEELDMEMGESLNSFSM